MSSTKAAGAHFLSLFTWSIKRTYEPQKHVEYICRQRTEGGNPQVLTRSSGDRQEQQLRTDQGTGIWELAPETAHTHGSKQKQKQKQKTKHTSY